MDSLIEEINALIITNPKAAVALSAFIGAVGWHQILVWLEANALLAVDKLTKGFREKQRTAAKKLGFTDAQILEMEKKEAHEALVLAQRAADDLLAPNDPPAPPAPDVQKAS